MTTADDRVRLTDDLSLFLRCCRFCEDTGTKPDDAAQLIALARRAFRAGVRHCNTNYNSKPALDRFEAKAEECGFEVEWPGLWPSLKRGNKWIELPC